MGGCVGCTTSHLGRPITLLVVLKTTRCTRPTSVANQSINQSINQYISINELPTSVASWHPPYHRGDGGRAGTTRRRTSVAPALPPSPRDTRPTSVARLLSSLYCCMSLIKRPQFSTFSSIVFIADCSSSIRPEKPWTVRQELDTRSGDNEIEAGHVLWGRVMVGRGSGGQERIEDRRVEGRGKIFRKSRFGGKMENLLQKMTVLTTRYFHKRDRFLVRVFSGPEKEINRLCKKRIDLCVLHPGGGAGPPPAGWRTQKQFFSPNRSCAYAAYV